MSILGQPIQVKLWQINVGKIPLILLDTDIEENPPHLRDITQELYVGDRAKRLQQELVLGIGGQRALERLGIAPQVYHINEGHAAFLILARLQRLMQDNHLGFMEAKAIIRASTVFTTHTPVIAGNENFDTDMVKEYLENDVRSLGLSFEDFASDAFINHDGKTFWLPALAIRFSRYVNAVSKMHRDVSRRMWAGLFPDTPEIELPIDYVTNGVHNPSWVSDPIGELLGRYVGPDYVRCESRPQRWDKVFAIDAEEVWQAHHRNKQSLITFIRKKLADDLALRGYIESKILKLTRALNPEYLTIVYARRFARYKRATLLLRDKERLAKILTNTAKPVQLIFAGKAHPADTLGKSMIKEIIDFAKDHQLEDRVVFLENYDINIARHLAWGADVWLNNPVRENEASGTSGMKAGMNGVLNLSVLDGWWPEGYNGKNGWAITGAEYDHQYEMQEAAEAEQIYDLIEDEITELYYDRNEAGVPVRWVEMMKESISSTCCRFNMNRVLADYIDKFYAALAGHGPGALREQLRASQTSHPQRQGNAGELGQAHPIELLHQRGQERRCHGRRACGGHLQSGPQRRAGGQDRGGVVLRAARARRAQGRPHAACGPSEGPRRLSLCLRDRRPRPAQHERTSQTRFAYPPGPIPQSDEIGAIAPRIPRLMSVDEQLR